MSRDRMLRMPLVLLALGGVFCDRHSTAGAEPPASPRVKATDADRPEPAPTEPQDSRLPAPAAEAVRDGIARVKEVFADNYASAKDSDAKQTLARELFAESQAAVNDVDRWCLLSESIRLAAEASDADLTFAGVDKIAAVYRIDRGGWQLQALANLAEKAPPQRAEGIARRAIALAREARATPEAVAKAMAIAFGMARKSQSKDLLAEVQQLQAEIRDQQKNEKELGDLLEKVAADPDNPVACSRAGCFLCFRSGDWTRGLPLLRKSGDAALRKLADLEVAAGDSVQHRLALADGWTEWAAEQKTWIRAGAEQRAYDLYAGVVQAVEGLERTRVRKRMASLAGGGAGTGSGAKVGPRSIPGLVVWLDTAEDGGPSGRRMPVGAKVERWRDLSGAGNDAVQPDESRRPVRTAGGLQFGGEAFLVVPTPLAARSLTVLVAYEPAKDAGESALVSTRQASSAGWAIDHQAGDLLFRVFGDGKTAQAILKPPTVAGPRICVAAIDGGGEITLRMGDGRSAKSHDRLTAAPSTIPLHVGGKTGNAGSVNFRGVLSRLLIYGRPLSAEEMAALIAWNQALPR